MEIMNVSFFLTCLCDHHHIRSFSSCHVMFEWGQIDSDLMMSGVWWDLTVWDSVDVWCGSQKICSVCFCSVTFTVKVQLLCFLTSLKVNHQRTDASRWSSTDTHWEMITHDVMCSCSALYSHKKHCSRRNSYFMNKHLLTLNKKNG